MIESAWAPRDFELNLDPDGEEWREAPRVTADRNYVGEPIAGQPTEIRSRWTNENLYLLYINPYDELNLKPDPTPSVETPRLWNWDVAEAFIGSECRSHHALQGVPGLSAERMGGSRHRP